MIITHHSNSSCIVNVIYQIILEPLPLTLLSIFTKFSSNIRLNINIIFKTFTCWILHFLKCENNNIIHLILNNERLSKNKHFTVYIDCYREIEFNVLEIHLNKSLIEHVIF